jgi:leader peptidase (prepilin peptidase)/N-methyltransferase
LSHGLWIPIAILGACIGSFLNVCIHRVPRRLSVIRPRSACPGCGSPIAWYDNLPVLSYLLLRGRCRHCQGWIALRYPLVEAATAALFVLLFLDWGPSLAFALHAALSAALVALIVIDARHQILPNVITLPGLALGLLSSPLRGAPHGLLRPGALEAMGDACVGAALGFVIPWGINAAYRGWQAVRGVPAAAREDGVGRGDFKLLAMIGAFLGLRLLLFTLFVGAVSGAAVGLLMIAFGGYGWKSKLPYGVFLGGAALLALFVGDPWVGWYLRALGVEP